jgi:hypothetical protein
VKRVVGCTTVVVVLVGGLLLASAVIGKPKTAVVHDPSGDGGAQNAASCDILKATSRLAKHGKLRHTVTTRGKVGLKITDTSPPVVLISSKKHFGGGLNLAVVLSPSAQGVHARIKGHHKTVLYTLKRSVIASELPKGQERYFWLASTCLNPADTAPNHGTVAQALKKPKRHHHHHHHPHHHH